MAEYLIQSETLDDIVDAINAKTGGSSAMTPAQMVAAIGTISGGGGSAHPLSDFAWHTVQFTLATDTATATVLNTYIGKYMEFFLYPADSDNTNLNTIAVGGNVPLELVNNNNYPVVTPTGVTLNPMQPTQYYVNDQTYNAVRARGNLLAKPAGNYILTWYGTGA